MIGFLLDSLNLVERTCSWCGRYLRTAADQGYLCGMCIKNLRPSHPVAYRRVSFVSSWKAFGRYEGLLSHALKLVKFKRVKPLARELGCAIEKHLMGFIGEVKPDLITWVPIHWRRFWERGFDHNEEILKGAGVRAEPILWRVKHAKPLASYDRKERLAVVRDAFMVEKAFLDDLEGATVLVFDDILTSGATSASVAELLLSVGVENVHFYFLAVRE